MNYSYERVSTLGQDVRRQEIILEAYVIDKRYIDKLSGKNTDRPQLQRLIKDTKAGDHIYTESISRLGRNVDDLRRLSEDFKKRGITVHFIKEGFNTSGHMYKFMLTILGAVAEMERELIVERVREGVLKAKRFGTKSGKPIGRPPAKLPSEFRRYYQDGKSKTELARLLQVSRATVYRYIKQYKNQGI